MRLYRSLLRRYRPEAFALSRRSFLTGAAASALLPVGTARSAPTPLNGRVVVIGAGFAGLACAHELKERGFDVTVLEARKRLGGRVLTFRDWIPGKTVEGGGELIGSNHPRWMHYGKRFGLHFRDMTDWEDADRPVLLNGRRLDRGQQFCLFEEMDEIYRNLTKLARPVDADTPWESDNATSLDSQTLEAWVTEQNPTPLTLAAIRAEIGADNGVPISQQSLLAMLTAIKGGGLEKFWTDSEVFRCREGNDSLAAALANSIGRRSVHLDRAVIRVEQDARGCIVTDKDNHAWRAEHVVLAVPPTTWDRITFNPGLPGDLRPQMGCNVKFLARLRKQAWLPSSPDALTSDCISETWNGTDRQAHPGGICLVGFSGGEAAKAAIENNRNRGDRDFVSLLQTLYPDFRNAGYDGHRFMNWPNEEWTMAGYSSAATGEITGIGKTLYHGIGRLQFAGEHSCYAFAGFMEGALQSGLRAARNVCECRAHLGEAKPTAA